MVDAFQRCFTTRKKKAHRIVLKKVEVVLLERPIGLLILITGTSLQDAIHSIFCTSLDQAIVLQPIYIYMPLGGGKKHALGGSFINLLV